MSKHLKKKGKHFKRLKAKHKFIIFLLIIVIIVSVVYILRYVNDKKEIKEESNLLNSIEIEETKITEEKTERMLQVEKLQEENSDIVGWIEVEGTNINYPVYRVKTIVIIRIIITKKRKTHMVLFF